MIKESFGKLTIQRASALVLAIFLCMLVSALAHAACTDPEGQEGQIVWNGDYHVPQVCTDVAGWVALGTLNPDAGGPGCSDPDGVEGDIVYNGDVHTPQYCDGDDWRAMIGTVGGGAPACTDDATAECTLPVNRSTGDPEFLAGNIADGVNILGVTGTLTGGGGCSEGGLAMGGYCWYFGESNQSCTAVCSSRGGYHEATRDYAGSGAGTDANCQALIDAFIGGLGGSVSATSCGFGAGLGCVFGGGAVRCTSPQTTANASSSGAHRICACQN